MENSIFSETSESGSFQFESEKSNSFLNKLPSLPIKFPSRSGSMITNTLDDVREKYHVERKEIGHGHYGVVRKCQDRTTGEWLAIKSIKKSKVKRLETLRREIQILKEMQHPNIIKLIGVHEDSRYLHLVTELCTGGELFDRIISKTHTEEGHFSERDAANIIQSILNAIHYCHDEKQIVHRDLKPENFLFLSDEEDSPIKIIDFGLSRFDNLDIMRTKVGTPYYVAPEVLRKEYTKACDIWSIGVITYILLCGYPPFYGDSDRDIFVSVKTGRFDFPSPEWDTISLSAKDFITCLLQTDPSKRLTAGQALNHYWIKAVTKSSDLSELRNSEKSSRYNAYMGMQKLKKAALAYIASSLTKEEVGFLGRAFDHIDKNKDGYITLQELDEALEHGNYSSHLRDQLTQIRKELSLKPEENLHWKSFITATIDESVSLKEDSLKAAFNQLRRSSENHIREVDLLRICNESQAKEVIANIDADDNGKISYDEFKLVFFRVCYSR